MLSISVAAAAISAAGSQASDATSTPARIDFTRLSDAELSAAYDAAVAREESDSCGFYMPLLLQMETRGTFSNEVSVARAEAELHCAVERKQWDVAYRQIKYLERAGRELSMLYTSWLARMAGALDDSAGRLLGHIDALEAGAEFELESQNIWDLYRELYKAGRQEQRLQLLRDLAVEPRFAKLRDDDREAVLSSLFAAEVENGNIAAATRLIDTVGDPYTMLAALGDRRYAPLWPQLEAKAGSNLNLILNAEVDKELASWKAAPENLRQLQQVAHAYLQAGRFEDVVTLVSAHRPTPGKMAEIEEDMGWALNVEAYALDALGRVAEADAVFDELAAIPVDPKKNDWLVSFVINRGSRLVARGEFAKGLVAVEQAAAIAEISGSDYARMLVRHDRICALSGLDRMNEVMPLLGAVEENMRDAAHIAAAALLCAKSEDKAAAVAIAGLSDPDQRGQMVEALQKPEFELFYTRSVLPSLSERIRPRKDVDAAFKAVARDIPERFIPLFHKRRSEFEANGAAAN